MNIDNKKQKELTEANILKKIQRSGVNSAEEYELIIHNLEEQSLRLLKDREQLKIRVDLLKQKQELLLKDHRQNRKKDSSIDYNRIRKELDRRYKEFDSWQKKCYNSLNKSAINVQVRDYVNQCIVIDNEISEHRMLLNDQQKSFKKLQKSIKTELKGLNRNATQIENLQEENKQLRKLIWNLRIEQDLTGHIEVRLQNNMVGLQKKERLHERLKTMTVEQIKREQVKSKLEIINQEVRLKNKNSRMKTESRISSKKSLAVVTKKEKQIEELEEENRKLKRQLIEVEEKRNILTVEQRRLEEQLKRQEKKRNKQEDNEIEVEDVCLQVHGFEDEQPLRRQIIGNETEMLQDDRIMLKGIKTTEITGLVVYENRIGIAYVKALYSNGKYTQSLISDEYLNEKCKMKKIILSDPKDYIKWVKAYYDPTSRRVVRIEIYSHNKIKFEVGRTREQILQSIIGYKFDNIGSEIPVCLRCSYRRIEQDWGLASLGVEINSLAN